MRRRREKRARHGRIGLGKVIVMAMVILGTVLGVGFATTYQSVTSDLPDIGDMKPVGLGQNTRIYDRDGKLLGYIAGVTNRTELPLSRIPISLREATVAIEDKRFYEHDGVDWMRIIGAAARNAMSSDGLRQGGSTITMQLVKNLYDPNAPRDFTQKIKEARNQRIPYLAVIGDKEVEARTLSVRSRDEGKELGAVPLDEMLARLTRESRPPSRRT